MRKIARKRHALAVTRGMKKWMAKIPVCGTCKKVKLVSYQAREEGQCAHCKSIVRNCPAPFKERPAKKAQGASE